MLEISVFLKGQIYCRYVTAQRPLESGVSQTGPTAATGYLIFISPLWFYRFPQIPPSYLRRPPHIHIRVTADGFNTLSAQHYPAEGSSKAEFDLVLIPD